MFRVLFRRRVTLLPQLKGRLAASVRSRSRSLITACRVLRNSPGTVRKVMQPGILQRRDNHDNRKHRANRRGRSSMLRWRNRLRLNNSSTHRNPAIRYVRNSNPSQIAICRPSNSTCRRANSRSNRQHARPRCGRLSRNRVRSLNRCSRRVRSLVRNRCNSNRDRSSIRNRHSSRDRNFIRSRNLSRARSLVLRSRCNSRVLNRGRNRVPHNPRNIRNNIRVVVTRSSTKADATVEPVERMKKARTNAGFFV